MTSTKRKLLSLKFYLKLALSFTFLGLIVWKLGGIREVVNIMIKIDPVFVFLILLINWLDRGLMTYKWLFLLRNKGIHLSLFQGMKIYCAAMVWGMFLPSTIGADVIRAISTSRKGHNSKEVVASIVIERIIGFLSSLLLGMLGLMLLYRMTELDQQFNFLWKVGVAVLIAAIILFVVSLSQKTFSFLHDRLLRSFKKIKIIQKLKSMHLTYIAYSHKKKILYIFFILTFCEQLMPIFHAWLIARGLNVDVGLLFLAGVVPLTILISRLPISIDGIGVYDGVFMLLISLTGVSNSEAIAIVFSGRILQIISWIPFWLAQIIESGSVKPSPQVLEKSKEEELNKIIVR